MLLRGWLLVLRRLLQPIGSSTVLLTCLVALRLALQGQSITWVSGQTAKKRWRGEQVTCTATPVTAAARHCVTAAASLLSLLLRSLLLLPSLLLWTLRSLLLRVTV